MLNELIRFSGNNVLDFVIKLVLCTVLICVLGPVTIPLDGDIDITLQTLAILFCAIAFGWQVGGLATLLYIIAGICGLPVFSMSRSGIDVVMGASGGFFFGFLFAAVVSGYLASLQAFQKPLAGILVWMAGHMIILLAGFLWYSSFSDSWHEELKNIAVGAIIKSMIGALMIELIMRFMRGRTGRKRAFEE